MHKFLLFTLLYSHCVFAKDYTKPPSIALRNEISYVSEVLLTAKNYKNRDRWQLKFNLIKNLHNTSEKNITILVNQSLAKSLELNVHYIIAYQTHVKSKVNGITQYQAYKNGATLIKVEGANPALFRYNKNLVNQLLSKPKQAKNKPQAFIQNIINGMFESDPKIQEFFLRE
jgi:hypothetical protein